MSRKRGMKVSTAVVLLESLWDHDGTEKKDVPGTDREEFLALVQHDYDEVDRLYVEYETIGG